MDNSMLSSIEMDRIKVTNHCEETLKEIEAARKNRDRATVERKIKEMENTLSRKFVKLFKKLPPITKEEAHEELLAERQGSFCIYSGYPSEYAWGSKEVAKRILDICHASLEQNVRITAEDWSHIK